MFGSFRKWLALLKNNTFLKLDLKKKIKEFDKKTIRHALHNLKRVISLNSPHTKKRKEKINFCISYSWRTQTLNILIPRLLILVNAKKLLALPPWTMGL